jgi:Pyruvate/2-oxoacid:ferredoxin oxidoreductase delta subunit
MSDNPNVLKSILLEDCSTQQKQEFAKMLAEHCATADLQAKGHQCWTFIPSPTEYEKMAKYNKAPDYDKCPKCGKRLGLQFYHGNMGEGVSIVCTPWGKGCGFKEYISDDC